MKTTITKLLLVPCLLFSAFFAANAQWVELNTGGVSRLQDIDCPTPDICYAAGLDGTVIKTTNGGNSWQMKNTGIPGSEWITCIFCLDTARCFTGGDDYICKTIDGGNSWQLTYVLNGFTDIYFPSDSIGYATMPGGGGYHKTTDGGDNWIWLSTVPVYNGVISSVYFIDNDIGFFGTWSNGVIETIDGGNNWASSLATGCAIYDVYFPTDSIGYAVGDNGCAYKTSDQGGNWITLTTGIPTNLNSVFCVDKDTCYAVGQNSVVIKTIDGGNNWSMDTAGVPALIGLEAIDFPSPTIGYTTGYYGANGRIIKKGASVGLQNIRFLTSSVLIAPNPFTDKTMIYYNDKHSTKQNPTFELYDMLGRKQSQLRLNTGSNTLERKWLASGIYLYKITAGQQVLKSGKIVIN